MRQGEPFTAIYRKGREEIIEALEALGRESGELDPSTVLEALGIELGEGVYPPTVEPLVPEDLAAAAEQLKQGEIPEFWPWISSIPWIFLTSGGGEESY